MRITVAQLNYHIGNFEKNVELITAAIRKAKNEASDLVVFSELAVTGYPPLDLLDHRDFINRCEKAVIDIARECRGISAIVGVPTINRGSEGKKLFNSALFLSEGEIVFSANKALLPTYDIFDEYRHFEPERHFQVFEFMGHRIALTICEDLWDEQPFDNDFEKSRLYTVSPMDELAKQDPDLIINISASPFSYTRIEARRQIFTGKARKHGLPVVAVNQVGANTELIFDGASMIIDRNGNIADLLPAFKECTKTFDLEMLDGSTSESHIDDNEVELIKEALVTGIKDYFGKLNFRKAVLGLSGGIDSAVCLCLATEALGSENVMSLLLPSRYSSSHSVDDAISICKNLGSPRELISIEKPFSAFEHALATIFAGQQPDVTEENIQARVRAVILMAYSNKFGNILLNTSNKSEAAVGYGTLYGDMAGGLSVIGDVYKTDVYRLARLINRDKEIIPENIIRKAPSAELRPDQYDSDSLPEYALLDSILHQYIELQKSSDEIIKSGYDGQVVKKVLRMINCNEYKRYQAPPILRISSKAFGAGRRMPLVARY
ncbi:MAG: NAD+ synthase [Bacteroidales bacterium]